LEQLLLAGPGTPDIARDRTEQQRGSVKSDIQHSGLIVCDERVVIGGYKRNTLPFSIHLRLTQETTGGVTTTYSYDDQGNTLAKTAGGASTSYNYDPNHRLIEADDGANLIDFEYDASGIRASRADSVGTTLYLVDHNRDYAQVLEEQDAFGGTLTTYTYGLDLLSQDQGAGVSYFHYDGLGSTRKLTDASAAITDSYIYKAFGSIEAENGSTNNAYLFTGEQFDEGLSQYYLRARYYDPANGRFTQMDTFQGVNRNPVSLHKYLYANASPGMFVDPSGNFTLGEISAAINVRAIQLTQLSFSEQLGISLLVAFAWQGSEFATSIALGIGHPHSYGPIETPICKVGPPRCTPEKVFELMLRFPAPNDVFGAQLAQPVYDTKRGYAYVTLFGGPIIFSVRESNNQLINQTLLGHPLHDGRIHRHAFVHGDEVVIRTIGEGTNYTAFIARMNELVGPPAFRRLDEAIRYEFYESF
jgi:RHS repeat-associated protein